jgi:hypothetical protein
MMHSPLHATICYLDPRLFGVSRHQDEEVMSGLYEAIDRLNPNTLIAALVRSQLRAYMLEEGIFGTKVVKYDRVESALQYGVILCIKGPYNCNVLQFVS